MPDLDRIAEMELALDRAAAAAQALDAALTVWEGAQGDFAALAAYMDSGEWLADYLADGEGRIPRDMKRGVLSQDALYDLLTEQGRVQAKMRELGHAPEGPAAAGEPSHIRPMAISDYDALHAMWLATPGMGLNDIDDSREGIARYLKRNPNTCFVAEQDRQLLGAIMAGHDGRRGYIYHTCVRADCRGQGLGRALTEAALDALRAEGISKVALVVFARNEGGNAFWERMGFTHREDLTYRNRALEKIIRIDT